jgi:hypothetical protein
MTWLSRRHVLGLGVGAVSAMRFRPAAADTGAEIHGVSVFGDLKYPPDFQHFDYVNIEAPKGGLFSLIPSNRAYNQSFFTFNSLNAYILKGEGAQGMDMTFVPLMTRAGDEPDAMYGLAAKSVRISPDKLVYSFTMRPEARFHDGSKLTAQDVAFSLTALKEKGHPLIVVQLRRSIRRWARGRTRSENSRPTATSNMSGSRTGGPPTFRSAAAATISIPYATSFIATAMSRSKASAERVICTAKSSPRGSGQHAMISRRSRTAVSSARPCRMKRRRADKAGSSIPASTSSKTRGCAKPSVMRLISNGPTRP